MALLKDLDDFDRNAQKGDWAFFNDDAYIAVKFGDDSKGIAMLPIKPVQDKAAWGWDGNREAPTLTPSILHWGDGKDKPATWHGFLREGKFVTA